MDFALTAAQSELQARARAFVREVLQPREVEFERANGRVPLDWGDPIRAAAIEARLQGGSFPTTLGGQGWSNIEQVLVHEQLGQATGGLWSYVAGAYNVLAHGDADQRRRYLDPAGFRLAVEAGLDLGAIVNAADTPEQREWHTIVRRDGLKAALAWRDARYEELAAAPRAD